MSNYFHIFPSGFDHAFLIMKNHQKLNRADVVGGKHKFSSLEFYGVSSGVRNKQMAWRLAGRRIIVNGDQRHHIYARQLIRRSGMIIQ